MSRQAIRNVEQHSHSIRYVHRSQKQKQGIPHAKKLIDRFSLEALSSVAEARPMVTEVLREWHRPINNHEVLEQHVYSYGSELPPRSFAGDYLAIMKQAIDEIRPDEPIIPLTLGAVFDHPDFQKTTSPGFPLRHDYRTKSEALANPAVRNLIHKRWDMIGRGAPIQLSPCEAFHRTVASENTKHKIRLTWGYPLEVTAEEARFFLPLFDRMKKEADSKDFYYGIGLETAKGGHEHLRRAASPPGGVHIFNSDISQFDQHVTDWIIRDTFSGLSSFFDFTRVRDSEGRVWNVNPRQTQRRWNALVSYFVKTKIRLPNGGTVQKFQGVPSGSMFTNLVDTIVNCVQMRTTCRRHGLIIWKDYYYGDDSTIFFLPPCLLNIPSFAESLRTDFGAILSVIKSEYTVDINGIHWLGYYARENQPTRDLRFLVASSIFPEREVESPLDACARLLGQAYSTFHPTESIPFLLAIEFLKDRHDVTNLQIETEIQSRGLKRFKYLTTLGYLPQEITVPPIRRDLFHPSGLRCDSVSPKLPSRRLRNVRPLDHLPQFSYVPEVWYHNWLRTSLSYDTSVLYTSVESPW